MNYNEKMYKEYDKIKLIAGVYLTLTAVLLFGVIMFLGTSSNNFGEPIIEVCSEPITIKYETPIETPKVIEVEMQEVEQDEILTLTSKEFINNVGKEVITSEVQVNVSLLHLEENFVSPSWDYKYRIKDVEIIWEFLVNQQNVHPNVAAGIIGCLYHEGTFGEQQGSYNYIDTIEEARVLLDESAASTGYGLAQWTFDDRRELLLKYYEEAFMVYPNDAYKASVVAELCCLIEELKGYNVFEDLTQVHSIEDATGRVARLYECYKGCEDDWKKVSGSYCLCSEDKSGTKRLQTAYDVYYHFME